MPAELIVVSGPLLGACYPLSTVDLRIGRAPASEIHLSEPDVAWEHCVVRQREGRHHIFDRRTGTGTYVNGLRITEHCFEAGDQVGIGETVLVYREDTAAQPDRPSTRCYGPARSSFYSAPWRCRAASNTAPRWKRNCCG